MQFFDVEIVIVVKTFQCLSIFIFVNLNFVLKFFLNDLSQKIH